MPHKRLRYLEAQIRKALTYSPIVGIIGQRQVGKTTLLSKIAESYITLDQESALLQAEADPEIFLENHPKPFVIDEVQLCPRLFPALKESVRKQPGTGRFLLSGSVRFTSREAIRESLTGRIVTFELLPFTLSEARSNSIPNILGSILNLDSEKALHKLLDNLQYSETMFDEHLVTGGLPGISFYRDASVRANKLSAQIDTILNRDIRLVSKTTLPYTSLRALLEYLAREQGRPFSLKAAATASRISTVSLKKIIQAFEGLFLIRRITSCGPEKKETYFLEDQGMATWLTGTVMKNEYDLCRGIYANLRQELHYAPEKNGKIRHFRTKHGVVVPLVFESSQGIVGIIPTTDRAPAPKTLAAAKAFLARFPRAKAVIATPGNNAQLYGRQVIILPHSALAGLPRKGRPFWQ